MKPLAERLLHRAQHISNGITTGHDWPNTQEELDRLGAAEIMREAAAVLSTPQQDAEDAARYRWLRSPERIPNGEGDGHLIVGDGGGEDVLWDEQLDRRIDAARSQEKQP